MIIIVAKSVVKPGCKAAYIDAHNASPHFTTIVPKLAEFRDGPGEVHFYQKAE